MFTVLWAAVFIVGVFIEIVALIDARRDDTLSEHIWHLNCYKWFRVLFAMSWFWLSWHFFVELYDPTFSDFALIIDDFIVLGLGAFVGYLLPEPSEKRARCK